MQLQHRPAVDVRRIGPRQRRQVSVRVRPMGSRRSSSRTEWNVVRRSMDMARRDFRMVVFMGSGVALCGASAPSCLAMALPGLRSPGRFTGTRDRTAAEDQVDSLASKVTRESTRRRTRPIRGSSPAAAQPPKSRAKKPLAAAFSAAVQEHRSLLGMPRRTSFLCWPQPAQVAFLQARQVVCRHMGDEFLSIGGRSPVNLYP